MFVAGLFVGANDEIRVDRRLREFAQIFDDFSKLGAFLSHGMFWGFGSILFVYPSFDYSHVVLSCVEFHFSSFSVTSASRVIVVYRLIFSLFVSRSSVFSFSFPPQCILSNILRRGVLFSK